MKQATNRYPSESKDVGPLFLLSLKHWWGAIRIAALPFFLAIILFYSFALLSMLASPGVQSYTLTFLGYLFASFCLLGAFHFVHRYWSGERFHLKIGMSVYVQRFFPALGALIIVFAVCLVLIVIGVFFSRLLTPYAHMLGSMGGALIVAATGFLALIWFVVTYFWSLYLVAEDISFGQALKKSMAANGLTKSAMTYLPVIGFIVIFMLTNQNMPWMKMVSNVWLDFLLDFIIKLALGAWVLNLTCLVMNNCEYAIPDFQKELDAVDGASKEK